MDLITSIREHSKQIHEDLEGVNGMADIFNGSITQKSYNRLLFKNLEAYRTVEDEILKFHGDFNRISNSIERDLEAQAVDLSIKKNAFHLTSEEESIGAQYVLMGSKLGAAVIAKQLENCNNLSNARHHFYRKPNSTEAKRWPQFMDYLKSQKFTENQKNDVINGVMKTFELFKSIYSN